MPILTDQKEPETPEYAMRYLFTDERNPQEDLRYAAIVLIILGGLGTLFIYVLI
jgi:hypothetical protein